MKKHLMIIGILFLAVTAVFAANSAKHWQTLDRNLYVKGDLVSNQKTYNASTVSLTSPTKTIDVSSVTSNYIIVTSDANQTGVLLTGGELYNVYTLFAGAGSNTMRLDDNAGTLSLGGNITLTESQNDSITLMCVDATNGYYARIYNADN